MKLFKKVLAVTAVLTLTFAAVPASAATDTIDFEDGNIPASIFMKTDDGGDVSLLTVEDYNGSKQLFVDIQDSTLVPKLQINVADLVGADVVDKVRSIVFDVTIVNPDGDPISWNGGGDGANTGADGTTWYNDPIQWQLQDDENAESVMPYSFKFVDGMGYTAGSAESSFLFMKWSGNTNDLYLDNIKFLDADGNPVAFVSADTDAAATDTAAAADTSADAPKTGATSYALYFVAGAAIMFAGAVVLKRRKTVEE